MSIVNLNDETYDIIRNNESNSSQNNLDKQKFEKLLTDVSEKVYKDYKELNIYDKKDVKNEVLSERIEQCIRSSNYTSPNYSQQQLVKVIKDKIFGYDFIQKYLEDDTVNDIMINSYKDIYIRKGQKDYKLNECFDSAKDFENFYQRICARCYVKINLNNPKIEFSDKDNGYRIFLTIPPYTTYHPAMVIRKRHKSFTMDELLKQGNISEEMCNTFNVFSKAGARIMISGQLESGKTTFLNSLINLINQRLVIMEDTAELETTNPNSIYLKTMNKESEEGREITLADLVKSFRRTNGQVPVVGEVRGTETVELFDLFNTGFRSGVATLHANSVKDTIRQLVFQIKASGKFGHERKEIEEFIGRTLDVIIYMEKRKIVEVTEIDYDYENEKIVYNVLHKFNINKETQNEILGSFEDCINPYSEKMMDRIRRVGLVDSIPSKMVRKSN